MELPSLYKHALVGSLVLSSRWDQVIHQIPLYSELMRRAPVSRAPELWSEHPEVLSFFISISSK